MGPFLHIPQPALYFSKLPAYTLLLLNIPKRYLYQLIPSQNLLESILEENFVLLIHHALQSFLPAPEAYFLKFLEIYIVTCPKHTKKFISHSKTKRRKFFKLRIKFVSLFFNNTITQKYSCR